MQNTKRTIPAIAILFVTGFVFSSAVNDTISKRDILEKYVDGISLEYLETISDISSFDEFQHYLVRNTEIEDFEEFSEDEIIAAMVDVDLVVKFPPKKRYTVKGRINTITKGKLFPIEV